MSIFDKDIDRDFYFQYMKETMDWIERKMREAEEEAAKNPMLRKTGYDVGIYVEARWLKQLMVECIAKHQIIEHLSHPYERCGHIGGKTDHDRAWYEENDPQSLVDSLNGNVNCPHNALRKMNPAGYTFTPYICGNCSKIFEVKEHTEDPEPREKARFDNRPPWGMRNRQA